MNRRGFIGRLLGAAGLVAGVPAVAKADGVVLQAISHPVTIQMELVWHELPEDAIGEIEWGDELGFLEDMRGLPLKNPHWEPAGNLIGSHGSPRKFIRRGEIKDQAIKSSKAWIV